MSRLLVRDNRLVLRPDGRLARDCDPDCCGPHECFHFARMVPCTPTSPDAACTVPPGQGVIYVCANLACMPPINGGWNDRPGGGIFHNGICWRFDAAVTRPEIPPGSEVIETGPVDCITCEDPRCGSFMYAEAEPCDPNYVGPRPLFCPAGLPFRCSTLRPSDYFPGQPNACFRFRDDAPTQPYPPGTPVLYFPPDGPWIDGRTCCQCNCTGGPPIPHAYCPGFSPGGYCCPDPAAWAASPLVINAFYRIDFDSAEQGWPPGLPLWSELYFTSISTAGAPTITIRYRTVVGFDGNNQPIIQEGFNAIDQPLGALNCPLDVLPLSPESNVFPLGPQIYDSCTEARKYDRWNGSWQGRNPTNNPQVFNFLQFSWNVQVFAPQPPGCSNLCGPGTGLATGGGGAGNGAGNGAGRQADPAVAGWMQKNYGGCRGCGDSPNPV